MRVQQITDILHLRERTRSKIPEQITSVVYLYVILFRMHKSDTAIEKEFDITLQMLPDRILAQRF